MEDNERLAMLIEKVEKDKQSATDLLEKSEKERKRISEKNAQLTINGNIFLPFTMSYLVICTVILQSRISVYYN